MAIKMRCLLAAFLAAGLARAQEPGHWSIGLGASAKADYPNPLTTTLLYFMAQGKAPTMLPNSRCAGPVDGSQPRTLKKRSEGW
jgi:hypothetical protein